MTRMEEPAASDDAPIARVSGWMTIDQPLIHAFADLTHDHAFIHVDPVAAAATPFGGTIAHGFLILSLLPRLFEQIAPPTPPGTLFGVNYGFDRIRFISPVRSGSRIRLKATPGGVIEKQPGQTQSSFALEVEVEGGTRPALTATWLIQTFRQPSQ